MQSVYASELISQEIWPDYTAHFKSDTTKDSYCSDIKEYMEYIRKDFLKADKKDIRKFYEHLQGQVEKGKIKAVTMAKKMRELHSFSDYINENKEKYHIDNTYENDYYPYLKLVAKQEKLARSVPVEHIDGLLKAAEKDLMAYCIFALLHRVGLTSTEIIALVPGDFMAYDNGVFANINGRENPVFIPEDVFIILEKYMAERESNEYLFYNRCGRKLNTMYISRLLKKYTSLAAIPSYSAQNIRNTCGFIMFAYGAEPEQVAAQMGVTCMQIKRYKGISYRDNLIRQAGKLVKLKVEPPN